MIRDEEINMNSSGKTLIIFLVIVAILLISLTAMSIFIFQKEIEKRKETEFQLEEIKVAEMNLRNDLKDEKKKNFILEEKNKEADERINSLLDELELEVGLREEVTQKYNESKDQLSKMTKEKSKNEDGYKKEVKDLTDKFSVLEGKYAKEVQTKEELRELINKMEAKNKELTEKISEQKTTIPEAVQVAPEVTPNVMTLNDDIDLEKIVIAPKNLSEGRILSVDKETEFVIVNLGQKDGIKMNMVLSVVRDGTYLGDIKITRLHPEMSAADLIPPFSVQIVRKNDKVVVKK